MKASKKHPENVALHTVDDATTIYGQTVQTKAMPLGNQTYMTDDKRATFGRWCSRRYHDR